RVTSYTFGTDSGRWLTRNVLLPFGGAFLAGQFAWLLVYERLRDTPDAPAQPGFVLPALTAESEPLAGMVGPAAVLAQAPPSSGSRIADILHASGTDLSFFGGWNERLWFHLAWLGLGLVLLALVRSAAFREAVASAGRAAYRAARAVFWELPVRVWSNPTVQALVTSWPSQLAFN